MHIPKFAICGLAASTFSRLVNCRKSASLLRLRDFRQAVQHQEPDFRLLADVPTRGVIVTAWSEEPELDFVSRFCAPAAGIDEDPVTGSVYCCLGSYWSEQLGRSELVGKQVSPRGGIVRVQIRGDRVTLCGQAVTVVKGEIAEPSQHAIQHVESNVNLTSRPATDQDLPLAGKDEQATGRR